MKDWLKWLQKMFRFERFLSCHAALPENVIFFIHWIWSHCFTLHYGVVSMHAVYTRGACDAIRVARVVQFAYTRGACGAIRVARVVQYAWRVLCMYKQNVKN